MKNKFNLKYLGITITAFVIIWLLTFIPVNLGFFNPLKNALYDFDVNDLVFSKFNYDKDADTNIVIVNIGYLNRPQLAGLITKVKSYKPKVVGLDILFRESKDPVGDSMLEDAIKSGSNTVIVSKLSGYNNKNQNYDTLISSISRFNNNAYSGYANLPSKDGSNYTTIRMFKPATKFKDSTVYAFTASIVKLFDNSSYNTLIKRAGDFETINYRGNADKFYYVDGTNPDNLNNLDFIKGKIVLFGFLGDYPVNRIFEDIFYTPLNDNYAGKTYPDMYGVVIHANIISMILRKDYINSLPGWIELLLAMIICYFNIVLLKFIKKNKIDWLSLISLATKTLEFVILLFIEMEILLNYNLKISITLILASIVLISDAEAIYDIITEKIISSKNKKQLI
jgi:CHASE2 domain-containing sensor protein